MRDYRLGLCVALVIAMWSARADAAITMSPNPVDVGPVLVDTTDSATGDLNSTSGSVRVDLAIEANACSGGEGTFTLTPNTDINLNMARTITVQFAPTASGLRQCSVSVYAKDTKDLLGSFAVRGTGQTPPTISVADPSNFGTIRFNNAAPVASSSRNITVTNIGNQPLNITGVSIGGTDSADFAITAGTTGSINFNATRTWTVRFNPDGPTAGTRSATMTFASNDPSTPSRVINLAGTATTASIATTATADFEVVAVGSSRSLDVTLTNAAAAFKGPLGVTTASVMVTNATPGNWFTFSACDAAPCTFTPALSIMTSTLAGIKCTPPSTAGTATQTARLTFTSDSDTAGANYTDVTCTAGSSVIAANVASVTFAPQLVNTPVTQMISVSNSGTSRADFYLEPTGASANQFTVTGPNCGSVSTQCPSEIGSTVMLTVTFTPTIEGPISANLNVRATPGPGPSLSLAGRGIDKHLGPLTPVEFPDTYRNPGTSAPQQTVMITNTGEYELLVEALTIQGAAAVWSLADEFSPFTVAPGLAHPVNVRFTPIREGEAEIAQLVVDTNDTDMMLVDGIRMTTLTGNGKLRNVDTAPGSIDVGDTFAGIPARLSIARPGELINVINMDETTFTIRDIVIDGPDAGVFELQDASGNPFTPVDIEPGATRVYDVVFSPSHPGDFEATVAVYLDEDPEPQPPVPIRGSALYIEAHGSGGCAAGGDTGGLVLVLVAGGIVIARRRRR